MLYPNKFQRAPISILGIALPIRHWDMAAVRDNRKWAPNANRGVNGIDGQLSTFLGLCQKNRSNWGIFGDLTTLYDMAGLWILPQLRETDIKIIVINNGGGKIFERLYPYKEMLNEHRLSFGPLAEMWSLDYTCLNQENNFQNSSENSTRQLIEIIPDEAATKRFWSQYAKIDENKSAMSYAPSV
nr:2-succinyl-5-enolpyruvyl-6-hydroxy-3- cyclohexene-1-carboxylate synthase [uncultured bacterium]